jgi:hypothetical protein
VKCSNELYVKDSTKSGYQPKLICSLRFEVFTAVTTKNDIFWDVTLCGSCKNLCFGGT